MKVTEAEFTAIKHYMNDNKPKNPAMFFLQVSKLMDRSMATIHRIDASKNYKEYKALVAAEHAPLKKRVPLAEQISDARISELLLVRSRGRLGAYRAACSRLAELGF